MTARGIPSMWQHRRAGEMMIFASHCSPRLLNFILEIFYLCQRNITDSLWSLLPKQSASTGFFFSSCVVLTANILCYITFLEELLRRASNKTVTCCTDTKGGYNRIVRVKQLWSWPCLEDLTGKSIKSQCKDFNVHALQSSWSLEEEEVTIEIITVGYPQLPYISCLRCYF